MKKSKLEIQGKSINLEEENGIEWFSLTELASKFAQGRPAESIRSWMKKFDTLNYLEAYEELYNPDFNVGQMPHVKDRFLRNNKKVNIQEYINETNAKFIRVKQGRYGGTFANFDIAAHFMMWISSAFQVWFVGDYRRMKEEEKRRAAQGQIFYAQKNVDNLQESLRNELDRLTELKEKAGESNFFDKLIQKDKPSEESD